MRSWSAMAASAKSCARCCGSTDFLYCRRFRSLTVTRDRRDGHDVYYGDAADPRFLETCGLAQGPAIITIHSVSVIDEVVEHVRAMRPDISSFRARATPTTPVISTASAPPTPYRKRSSEPPALGGGFGRARHRHGASDRLDPRETRCDSARLAGGGAAGRTPRNSFGESQDPQEPGCGLAVVRDTGDVGGDASVALRSVGEVKHDRQWGRPRGCVPRRRTTHVRQGAQEIGEPILHRGGA